MKKKYTNGDVTVVWNPDLCAFPDHALSLWLMAPLSEEKKTHSCVVVDIQQESHSVTVHTNVKDSKDRPTFRQMKLSFRV